MPVKKSARGAKAAPAKKAARPAPKLAEYRAKRDFGKTREPSGGAAPARRKAEKLAFVIQKHAATQLHFDLRLELDGVMLSWAVPKGPNLDPSVKRLAMQVEDHPIEYNSFEGTIPKGEYGGGTVMLWDRGTYESAGPDGDVAELRRGYEKGDFKFVLHGKRLRGSWVLVRTRNGFQGKAGTYRAVAVGTGDLQVVWSAEVSDWPRDRATFRGLLASVHTL